MRDNRDIRTAIEAHSDTVMRICTLYFHGGPDREDAFQETFLKYAQSEKRFADEEHRKAWLITVASNTCKDMIKRSSSKTVSLEEVPRAEDEQRRAWEDQNAQQERAEELAQALQKIDETYRITLYLKYYEGYKASEIAALMDMPENTVYTNLARGREKLKEVLANER